MANEAAYHLIEKAEKEENEIDDALSLSEEERSLSSGIFNILGTLVKGEPLQILRTSGFSGFEAWRKLSKRYNERDAEKQQETNMKEMRIRFGRNHGRDCETIYQEDRNYCQWVLDVETGNLTVIEFRNFIKARNEQELEEGEARIEESRRTVEAEAREKERIMKQIRRAEMENERLESRDNNNARDDNDTKNFTTDAKGSKARADKHHDRRKGRQSKN